MNAGYWPLLRFALKRDRVKLPAWVLGTALFAAYCSQAIHFAVPKVADLRALSALLTGPAGIVLVGPGYGFDQPNYANVFAGAYGLYVMLLAACGSILLAVRHTRAEEEAERFELMRALPVARHTPLAVAATMLLGYVLLVTLLVWATIASAYGAVPSLLCACSIGMVALVFGAAGLVTAQISEHARTATGYAFLLLGIAFLVRGVGDVLGDQAATTERGSLISWFSPLAWAQQTRVFVDDRWWPLGLGVVLAVLFVALAVTLQGRRDLGTGLVASIAGPASAGPMLVGPFSLMLRLQRGSMIGWTLTSLLAGISFGALANQIESTLGKISDPAIVAALGGDPARLLDGYYGICLLFGVILASGFAILTAQRLSAEERSGRAEMLLAGPLGHVRWITAAAVVALGGAVLVLVAGGAATGAAAALSPQQGDVVMSLVSAALSYIPAVAVIAAVAFCAYAISPSLPGWAWAIAGYAFFVSSLGKALQLPDWAARLSVFEAVGAPPIDTPHAGGMWVLGGIAVVLFVGALVRLRTRDLPR